MDKTMIIRFLELAQYYFEDTYTDFDNEVSSMEYEGKLYKMYKSDKEKAYNLITNSGKN
jgi:hypothetical protein